MSEPVAGGGGGAAQGRGRLAVADLMYVLAEGAIATAAAEPRDSARMLVVRRSAPERVEHLVVRDLPGLLPAGMVMVRNVSRVLAARVVGVRRDSGGRVEGLYLSGGAGAGGARGGDGVSGGAGGVGGGRGHEEGEGVGVPRVWRMYLRMKRPRAGVIVDVCLEGDGGGAAEGCAPSGVWLELLRADPSEPGVWEVAVGGRSAGGAGEALGAAGASDAALLERVGRTPLPPYIVSARSRAGWDEAGGASGTGGAGGVGGAGDRARYQAVYAGAEAGSVAAPTAGLHMTAGLIGELVERGVSMADVVLHVGAGTFKPVTAAHVEDHVMHAEWCRVPAATRRALAGARAGVLAVGTTSVRTLESFPELLGGDLGVDVGGQTRLLITPGHRFRFVDALLTNFHLPGSTLMALVAALMARAGEPPSRSAARVVRLYEVAMARGYRFYSYGDAMLILP